jgi:murein L,D-transpeptidase YcbB/YkuD
MQEELRSRIEQLSSAHEIEGVSVGAGHFLTEFYSRRDFRLAWEREAVNELVDMVSRVGELGLDPDDYFHDALKQLSNRVYGRTAPGADDRIALDILATGGLARLGIHLTFGKVTPRSLDPNWNLSRSLQGRDPVDVVQAAIDSGALESFVRDRLPDYPFYRRLRQTLARYRELESRGGWSHVPTGPTLRRGDEGERVTALARRLQVSGDLADGARSESFDAALETAVIRFQKRHRLGADGIVGKQTLAALNVSAEARVDQIRVNLERMRWVFRDIDEDFVLVNIAGFELWLVRDRQIVWQAIAQVGKTYRQTPVFKSTMKYVVFNPTWTVPPTILKQDVLPKAKKDPDYLRSKNMKVIDRNGNVVPTSSVDWASVSPRSFPYAIRQEPGPQNALGRVKFIFPNEHFVFLHDTPSRHLFDRPDRAFSSGCIRVQHPLRLAELLMEDSEKWSRERIDELIESEKTQTVFLAQPLSVMLLYWTVDYDPETGEVHFLQDVYGRDRRVLEALDAPFVFHPFDEAPAWMPQTSR